MKEEFYMARGRVKRFDEKKGYGFIEVEGSEGRDIFVHYSDIESDGFKTLTPGDVVEFELIEGDKGLKATKIRRATE
jgi:CspA family cold shock protein